MGLFSDIYNTVAKFFRPQEEQGDTSKSLATNRLKLVLMQDRTNLTPRILEQMRGELIDLLSRYVELDKELLELNFEQEGEQVALMLSIPVIRAKDEEEFEAALKGVNEGVNEEVNEGVNTEENQEVNEGVSEGVNEGEPKGEPEGETEEVDDNNDEGSENSEEDTTVADETEEENKTVSKPRKKRSAKSKEEAEEEITN